MLEHPDRDTRRHRRVGRGIGSGRADFLEANKKATTDSRTDSWSANSYPNRRRSPLASGGFLVDVPESSLRNSKIVLAWALGWAMIATK
jgi:hypothetical protein